ncbi:hypothetical protein CC80DRAFT_553835 [Byssothecium circinans]|uniref:F-box domain-containing protein n=1 Tax=Byssothecium circinans TaxID=147558 RepID=A0A6A5TDR0_9PLEO|nr:hypothetical protein CC80DRAFT_553835 [Byssothecium circinans]
MDELIEALAACSLTDSKASSTTARPLLPVKSKGKVRWPSRRSAPSTNAQLLRPNTPPYVPLPSTAHFHNRISVRDAITNIALDKTPSVSLEKTSPHPHVITGKIPAPFRAAAGQSATFATPAQKPFRFMDLPPELRLMVYERLPREIKHVKIELPKYTVSWKDNPYIVLIKKTVHTSILATCRLIHVEANRMVQNAIRNFILEDTPKMIICTTHQGAKYAFEVHTAIFTSLSRVCTDMVKIGPHLALMLGVGHVHMALQRISMANFKFTRALDNGGKLRGTRRQNGVHPGTVFDTIDVDAFIREKGSLDAVHDFICRAARQVAFHDWGLKDLAVFEVLAMFRHDSEPRYIIDGVHWPGMRPIHRVTTFIHPSLGTLIRPCTRRLVGWLTEYTLRKDATLNWGNDYRLEWLRSGASRPSHAVHPAIHPARTHLQRGPMEQETWDQGWLPSGMSSIDHSPRPPALDNTLSSEEESCQLSKVQDKEAQKN